MSVTGCRFRVGGAETRPRYAGMFGTMREARARQAWVLGELAAMRVPDLTVLVEPDTAPTLADVAKRWQESRVDVSENTKLQHRSAVRAVLPILGTKAIDAITVADVNEVIATLAGKGRKRETIRKTVMALGMILRYAGHGWTERERENIRLPRGEHVEIVNRQPAEHVLAVHRGPPLPRYRLPLLVLDATGMRLGELEGLYVGRFVQRAPWPLARLRGPSRRRTRAAGSTSRPFVFDAVTALVAREDRTPERSVFLGFAGTRFRTAITRALHGGRYPNVLLHMTFATAGSL